MTTGFRVVVLGGYGAFGSVVSRRLAADRAFDVVVAGRDAARAQALASALGARSARLDHAAPDFTARLRETGARLVIHAAGPFQGQGYGVARAALEAGMHYVDLADGRDFVCRITALDAEARRRGLLVVSGASSVPALSAAVADHLAARLASVEAIAAGISSSATMPGPATVRGVLACSGQPISVWHEGGWVRRRGWQGLRPRRFRLAGMRRWLCDCDVPDLALFPERYPGVRSVRFGAGTELIPAQAGLWVLSWLGRAGIVNPARAAAALWRAGTVLAGLGSGRSAMFVRVEGRDAAGRMQALEWELFGRRDHGRRVPCMAAVALARKMAGDGLATAGATPCVGLVTLDEYLRELDGLDVATGFFGGPLRG